MKLKGLKLINSCEEVKAIPPRKVLVNTINAYSYVMARQRPVMNEALTCCDYLSPDGMSVVWASRWLNKSKLPLERVTGWNLFSVKMEQLNADATSDGQHRSVMFIGGKEETLEDIKVRARQDYPMLDIYTYSPPFRQQFSEEETRDIIQRVNNVNPDILWIGLGSPKQEEWTYTNFKYLEVRGVVGCIGAVFDFYTDRVKRAPMWMQRHGLEWLHRLFSEPGRLWRRYLIGNTKFIYFVIREKL